jgi:hypothetical protein
MSSDQHPSERREPECHDQQSPPKRPCRCGGTPRPPFGTTTKPKRPGDCGHKRGTDCCEQLLEVLRRVPGLQLPDVHKPKRKPSQKAACLCGTLGIRDAVAPAMVALFDRFDAGENPRNEYEAGLFKALDKLSTKQQAALKDGFAAYRKLSKRLRECLFDDRLVKPGEHGLNPSDIIEAIIGEGLSYLGQTLYSNSDGIVGPGLVRPWTVTLPVPPNGSGAPQTFVGPWPWLTALRPDPTAVQEFGSKVSFHTEPGGPPYPYQPWQIARDCTYSTPPAPMSVTCVPRTPPPPPPGSLFPNFCDGGEDYTLNGQCMQFAVSEPGATIALRGANFITPSVTVRFAHRTDPSVRADVPAMVFGDQKTPVTDAAGHPIIDWRVSDMAIVAVPKEHPASPGTPLPPGLYDVSVLVNNVTSAMYAGGVAPQLESNKVILQVDPDPTINFNFWTDHGHCYSETDGLGSDEIWWDAWVINFKTASTTAAADLGPLNHIEFSRDPWDDMDSGEDAGGYSATLWNGAIGHGIVVAGLVGFEVDSEAAAREQLKDFGDSFAYYLGQVWSGAVAAEGTAAAIAKMVSLTLTQGLIALAVVAAVILIVGVFWASWAAADQIAIDIIAFNARQAWDLTAPVGQLPAQEHVEYGTDQELSTSHSPVGKHQDVPGAMVYDVENHYWSGEEDSHYGLTFHLARM